MRDDEIIDLLFERREKALGEVQIKYEAFCHTVSSNILSMREDREECFNEMLLVLWNNIPPEKPQNLKAYIAKIIRNIALKKSRSENIWRRCSNFADVGEEFLETIPDSLSLAERFESERAGEIINDLLGKLPQHEREVFVLRYYFGEKVSDVAYDMGFTVGKVKSILMRIRIKLSERLKKEGILN